MVSVATAILIRRNLKRHWGRLVTLGILTLLAAAVANLAMIVATGYNSNFDRRAQELGTTDLIVLDPLPRSPVAETLRADERVTEVDVQGLRGRWSSVKVGGTDLSSLFLFTPDQDWSRNQYRVTARAETTFDDGIVIPFTLASDYPLGETITIRADGQDHTFHVQGYLEATHFAGRSFGVMLFVTNPGVDVTGWTNQITLTSANVIADVDADKVLADTEAAVRASAGQDVQLSSASVALLRTGGGLGPGVFALSLLAFAAVLLLVVVIVLRTLIAEAISQDSTAIGALKAFGYRTGRIIASVALPYVLGGAAAALAGIALSYLVLPALSWQLSQQGAVVWSPGLNPFAGLVSAAVLLAPIALAAGLAALRVRSLSPVVALRGGLEAHDFRAQPFPLDRARGAVPERLGLGHSLVHPGRAAATTMVLALVLVFASFAVGMVRIQPNLAHFLVGDYADVTVERMHSEDVGATLEKIRQLPGVEKAYRHDSLTLTISGRQIAGRAVQDFDVLSSSAYEGREPRHDNEIAIGPRVADLTGAGIGDTIAVDFQGQSQDFLVVGLLQGSRRLGMFADLTYDGVRRIVPEHRPTGLWVFGRPGQSSGELRSQAEALTPSGSVGDMKQAMETESRPYSDMMLGLIATIVTLTVATTALVTGVVITTQIRQQARDFGVLKALGFASRQLRRQILAGLLPPLLLGATLGGVAGWFALAPGFGALLAGVGFRKVELGVEPWMILVVAVGVVLLGTLVAWGASARVKRISAYALITE